MIVGSKRIANAFRTFSLVIYFVQMWRACVGPLFSLGGCQLSTMPLQRAKGCDLRPIVNTTCPLTAAKHRLSRFTLNTPKRIMRVTVVRRTREPDVIHSSPGVLRTKSNPSLPCDSVHRGVANFGGFPACQNSGHAMRLNC